MTSTRTTHRSQRRAEAPQIREMARQHVAVVQTVGDPNSVAQPALAALFGTVYALKFARKKEGRDFKIGMLRARWPDISTATPASAWRGLWALAIPDDVEALTSKDPDIPVTVEDWEYGTVAEILHLGPYAEEPASLENLHAFVTEQGYETIGPHEEEYHSMPQAKVPRTVLRCRIKPAVAAAAG